MAASLLAHGALFGALPRGWQPAATFSLSAPASEPLRVSFLPAAAEPAPSPRLSTPSRHSPGTPLSPRYFAVHELDQRPQVVSHVEPRFPALALAPSGRVVLRLYLGEGGGVDKVAIESGDPNGAFEASAREAFAAARFLPGMKDGAPVKALLRIEVLFGSPHPENIHR